MFIVQVSKIVQNKSQTTVKILLIVSFQQLVTEFALKNII